MYTLVRRFIKTGIGFLFAGLGLGLWMMVRREFWGEYPHPGLISAHAHAVGAGFVMFLILGVALWLFPRPDKEDRRYTPGRIAVVYWVLTVSTLGRVLSEVARSRSDQVGWFLVASGCGQVLGIGLYFWKMWGRIRPVGSHLREAKGERF